MMIASHSVSQASMVSHKKLIRVVVLVALILAMFSCGALVHAYAGGHEEGGAVVAVGSKVKPVVTVEVEKGDTLWTIARAHAPSRTDIRDYISQIMKANGLSKPDLHIGQLLVLP